ncbi:hypothetical protein MUY27_14285 [Mucilaginibacter sp. RS28]|uniref:NlpE C-terminal OB domain-containing protein n=1 Tax=Mucilaginibacter straminoryzae TaxID=2932774 RepID=A0A9X1X4D3_9SPHI|nr:hypothetical protein [Mucilaginibacter straminoryzae]MCJ8210882.1 hypothetical protein [Mucilaginibacter straminoryzae]
MQFKLNKYIVAIALLLLLASCVNNANKQQEGTFKGLYSYGPDSRSLKDCDNNREYWVKDESGKLELEYSQMNVEKPYVPVYIEVEGTKVKSGKDGQGSEFDSTIIVKKLIRITREIPQDMCN